MPMIRFSCPTCSKSLKAPDEKAGAKSACPYCGQRVQVPPPVRNRIAPPVHEGEGAAIVFQAQGKPPRKRRRLLLAVLLALTTALGILFGFPLVLLTLGSLGIKPGKGGAMRSGYPMR